MTPSPQRWLFVTGKLAAPALHRLLAEVSPRLGITYEVLTLNISVASLMTTEWIARHLPQGVCGDRIMIPGLCRGELEPIHQATGIPAVRGPADLRDLPEFFGSQGNRLTDYGGYDIQIIAEINHAPRKSWEQIYAEACHFRTSGADVIDIGCEPGSIWPGVGETVRRLRALGFRVSIDSLAVPEIEAALEAGAELVLSVNSSNLQAARRWGERYPYCEVVAIPDRPDDLDSLLRTAEQLAVWGVRCRLDPILEPIGFGFAHSLGRYIEVRRRFPDAPMLMGVGNLTELTDADSAGINVLLAGFCQELRITSILTTEVINWARSSVREWDLARRLVHYAVRQRVLPKRLEPDLILLRDPKLYEMGEAGIAELAANIRDRNYRIIAERGEIHILNRDIHLRGTDPFELFEQLLKYDQRLDPSHAFYLGYELAKAVTALTLHKNYVQDQPLRWGFLTLPERGRHERDSQRNEPPRLAEQGR